MLFNRKGVATTLTSGALALTLVAAAAEGGSPAMGTASSSLNAITLTVTGIDGVPSVSLLDISTLASTDPDAAGNLLGANFASAAIAPLTVDGVVHGGQTARSDGASAMSSDGVDISALGLPVSSIVSPVNLMAQTDDTSARAAITAATASLSAVTDLLGLQVTTAGVVSEVTAEGARQDQGVSVSGLDVKLGDLLPEELLAALPLDVLLDILAQLPVGAPDVQGVVDAVNQLIADIEASVAGVVTTATGISDSVDALAAALANLASQEAIVAGLEVDVDVATDGLAAAVAALTDAVDEAAGVADSIEGLACVTDNLLNPTAAAECIAALQADADTAVAAAQQAVANATDAVDQLADDLAAATSLLAPLAQAVDVLTDLVNDLVDQLVALINNLLDFLNDLLAALTDLSNSLGDIIDGLLDTTLLGLGNLELVMGAIATADPATSTAGVNCSLSDLTVAGVNIGGGSCTGDDLTGSLTGALGSLDALLNSLPIVGDALPTVSVSLLDFTSSVTEADGVVTSTASVVPMTIDLPSVTIDPAGLIDGLLAQLNTDLLDDLLASLPLPAELQGVGLGTAATTVEGLLGLEVPDLQDVQVLIGDVLALLPDGLGIPSLTTPGFNLTIDPVSTASFSPGSNAAAPAPGQEPLPATGGGAIAFAAIGLSGAWSLRRRR